MQQIKMKPKFHFILKAILLWLVLILLFILCIYFISLFIFISSETNEKLHNPEIITLIRSMSSIAHIAIILSIACFSLTEYISAKYTLVYKKHLIYSLLGLGLVVIGSSLVINKYRVHPMIRERFEKNNIHFPPRPPEFEDRAKGFN